MSNKLIITYLDFNNNSYKVSTDRISYEPIRIEDSSSGEYSGGEPAEAALTEDEFLEIYELAKAIMKDKTLHRNKRRMLTAMMIHHQEEEAEKYILARTEPQRTFAKALKSYVGT